MTKAILQFDLNKEDERQEHLRTLKATNAYLALHKIKQRVRNKSAYLEGTLPDTEKKVTALVLNDVHEIIQEALFEYNIDLDEELK